MPWRAFVEVDVSRWKRVIGPGLRSQTDGRQAIEVAKPGDIVMLSPACASFDQFRDYEARGDAFRQIVEALSEPAQSPAGANH